MTAPKPPFWSKETFDGEALDQEKRGAEMWQRATSLWEQFGVERRDALDAQLTVYYGNSKHGLTGSNYTAAMIVATLGVAAEGDAPPGQNVIQKITDMMVSHTIHDRVRPFFLTERGDVDSRTRAQGMADAVEGVFTSEGIWGELGGGNCDLGIAWCKMGFVSDGGFVKAFPDYARSKVTYKLLLPHQWLVERGERVAFEFECVDRYMLLEDFGWEVGEDGKRAKTDLHDKILRADRAPKEYTSGSDERGDDESCDQILVVTGYHRPSGYVDLDDEEQFGLVDGELSDEADVKHDGVRMVMIDTCVLHEEPWPYDEFPVAEFFPAKDPIAYGSRGVPETLAGGQLALNNYNRRIEEMLRFHARALLVMWRNAKINPNKITNGVATILQSNVPPGQAIQHIQPQAVSPDLINRADKITAFMQQQYGVNDMALSGEKPPGVDHAPGMEFLNEELTLRHTEKSTAWKRANVKLARWTIESFRMLALRDADLEVVFQDAKHLRRIKWKECELKRREFALKPWPTNLLAKTPAAKLRRLTELIGLGLPPTKVLAALAEEFPDMQAITGDTGSAERNIKRKIDKIAKEGFSEEYAPHTYINFTLAKELAVEAINRLEEEGNDEGMDRVIEFYEAVVDVELSTVAKEMAAQQGIAPGAPAAAAPAGAAPPQEPPAPQGGAMLQ